MMPRMTTTPFATGPMADHNSTMLIPIWFLASASMLLDDVHHLKLKITVTVAITGTGSLLSNVGEYFHCFTA